MVVEHFKVERGGWDVGSYLAFDVDAFEGRRSCVFKHCSSLAGQEADATVFFAFNKMLAAILTNEIETLARSCVRI